MLDIMVGLPPIIHRATAVSNDGAFWMAIGILAVLVVVAIVFWIMGNRRIVQRQAQVKEAERHYETFPQPTNEKQPQIHAQEEEKVLLPR